MQTINQSKLNWSSFGIGLKAGYNPPLDSFSFVNSSHFSHCHPSFPQQGYEIREPNCCDVNRNSLGIFLYRNTHLHFITTAGAQMTMEDTNYFRRTLYGARCKSGDLSSREDSWYETRSTIKSVVAAAAAAAAAAAHFSGLKKNLSHHVTACDAGEKTGHDSVRTRCVARFTKAPAKSDIKLARGKRRRTEARSLLSDDPSCRWPRSRSDYSTYFISRAAPTPVGLRSKRTRLTRREVRIQVPAAASVDELYRYSNYRRTLYDGGGDSDRHVRPTFNYSVFIQPTNERIFQ